MPLLKPKRYERKKKFISRCISNNKMQKEFPKRKQRIAVCYDIWREDKNKKRKK